MLLPVGPVLFLFWSTGAVMFDLTKINEVLGKGHDRVRRILGKENTKKVVKNGWQAYQQKKKDAGQGDSEAKLRGPSGR